MRRLSVCVCVCERVGVREKGRELHVAFRFFYQISLNNNKKPTASIIGYCTLRDLWQRCSLYRERNRDILH